MDNRSFLKFFLQKYPAFKNTNLFGRYITFPDLQPELEALPASFEVVEIGRSVSNSPIHSISFGKGPVKVLAWSQMHGNESTTTKALFDLFSFFDRESDIPEVANLLNRCTLKVIPMLNPDGAMAYTRENSNAVDLNRDAAALTQQESRVLRKAYESFDPDYCFNLHDQRTIFGAGDSGKPATLSFLAPSMDLERSINIDRENSMKIIADVNKLLQDIIPGQIGRFDDAFNINCTGDSFMALGVPTLLFESGHYPMDYMREETRKFMAAAILVAIGSISSRNFIGRKIAEYQAIPENEKNFLDIILKNALLGTEIVNIGVQYVEKISEGKLDFLPKVVHISRDLGIFGHKIIDCEGKEVSHLDGRALVENDIVEGILLNQSNISFIIEENY